MENYAVIKYFEYHTENGNTQIILYNSQQTTTFDARYAACHEPPYTADDAVCGKILRIEQAHTFYRAFRSVLSFMQKSSDMNSANYGERRPQDIQRLKEDCEKLDITEPTKRIRPAVVEEYLRMSEKQTRLRFIKQPDASSDKQYVLAFDIRDFDDLEQAQICAEQFNSSSFEVREKFCYIAPTSSYELILANPSVPWIKERPNHEAVIRERELEVEGLKKQPATIKYFEYHMLNNSTQIIMYNAQQTTTYQARYIACGFNDFLADEFRVNGKILKVDSAKSFYHVFRSVLPFMQRCFDMHEGDYKDGSPQDLQRLKEDCETFDAKEPTKEMPVPETSDDIYLRFIKQPNKYGNGYVTALDTRDFRDIKQAQLISEQSIFIRPRSKKKCLYCNLSSVRDYEYVLGNSNIPWLKEELNYEEFYEAQRKSTSPQNASSDEQ